MKKRDVCRRGRGKVVFLQQGEGWGKGGMGKGKGKGKGREGERKGR